MELRQRMADAPLNRIGEKAKEFAGQDVQLEAPPVTELSGNPTEDLKTGGMRGNYEAMVAKAKDLPPEDQKPYLDQIKKQYEADTATAKAGILGQTRKRTADEALDMAVEDAKINDLPGYTAYENTIGKTKREDRKIDSLERKYDLSEKKSDAEVADRRARADWLQTHQKEKLELDKAIAQQRMERGGGADDKDPAPVKTAKWLAANKNDPAMMEAWDKANQTKSKDIKGIAADLMARDSMLSAPEAAAKAKELVEAIDRSEKKAADKPITQEEYARLPSGAVFTAPDGTKRRKP
jgi:hypothetical protein